VTWAVVHSDDTWSDLDRLTPAEREAVDDTLSGWVESGPPQDRARLVGRLTLFEHHVGGVGIVYLVEPDARVIGLLRVRPL
jgi:mRNA-degrading endonuclease RelE of RelBE toxin-antitoxin system